MFEQNLYTKFCEYAELLIWEEYASLYGDTQQGKEIWTEMGALHLSKGRKSLDWNGG